MILLIKLILAHLIGDFMVQPTSWVRAKEKKKLKAYQLYLHALLHGVLTMVLVWDISFLLWAILIAVTHLVIDGTKLVVQNERTARAYFFADQLIHLISIYLIYSLYTGNTLMSRSLLSESNYLLVTIITFLTLPASYLTSIFISKWAPHTQDSSTESLQDAGKSIGILERLLTFVFIATGHWEAVGFLLTAKSIFRFGDLKEPRERKLTEYILIGSLISFGIAIMSGLVYNTLLAKLE